MYEGNERNDMSDETAGRGRRSKVDRLIEEHELDGIGHELAHLWTMEDPEQRHSLRDLEEFFNKRLLESRLANTNLNTPDLSLDTLYQAIHPRGTTPDTRIRFRRMLERENVDFESLQSDFVSYQAIRTYLKEHRDAEPPDPTENSPAAAVETVQKLSNRLSRVAESRLEGLETRGEVSVGDYYLLHDLTVVCDDCGHSAEFASFVRNQGCDCE